MSELVLGLDIGTASSKAVLCSPDGTIEARAVRDHEVSMPRHGWFEHDAEATWWDDVCTLCSELLTGRADRVAAVKASGRIALLGRQDASLTDDDLVLHRRTSLPFHPNGMRFFGYDADGACVRERTYYSVGGGFVVDEADFNTDRALPDNPMPYPFHSAEELLRLCHAHGFRRISDLMWANELSLRSEEQIHAGLAHIWAEMQACVRRGLETEGTLPGGLRVRRRAPMLYRRLNEAGSGNLTFDSPSPGETMIAVCKIGGLGDQKLTAEKAKQIVAGSRQPTTRGLAIRISPILPLSTKCTSS